MFLFLSVSHTLPSALAVWGITVKITARYKLSLDKLSGETTEKPRVKKGDRLSNIRGIWKFRHQQLQETLNTAFSLARLAHIITLMAYIYTSPYYLIPRVT